ncbi:acyl-CoA dehydrogenase [Nocardioides terrisoli]|uniref:acyl-CoA dehydrogenase n=1 Tax=Nocardioides terrisoli TaxID=3388267 RepID=UPI00287B8DCE|nr:acyl-CoA dehydrogenase family protein [Nocardioides marmorisolisilvae]
MTDASDLGSDIGSEIRADIRTVVTDVLDKGPGIWSDLAAAGLLSLAAPERYDGEGLGLDALGVLMHETGRRAVDLPLWETLACGLLPVVRCGSPTQQDTLVPDIAAGSLLIAPALDEPGRAMPVEPDTRLAAGSVTGTKIRVPMLPSGLLIVSTDGGAVLVDPAGPGVSRTETPGSAGRPEATYRFDAAPAVHVLGAGSGGVLRAHAIAGLLLHADGLLAGARDLTAGYIRERVQFGRRLAEFQAVALQVADVYIASRTISLAAAEVVRRIDAGQQVEDDLAVAAYVVCDRAPRALQTCHHLHGGMGVDETYPLARYFARIEDISRLLGGAAATLTAAPIEEREAKNAELTEAQRAFKSQVRDYFAGLVTREDRLEMLTDRHGPAYHRIIKQMGSDGWMGVGWPTEYGGKGLGGIEQQIFANEAARGDVHLPAVTLQTVGPTLQAFGTEKQKDMFLERILAGDVHFAIGYSEADAGTDLASLRCAARKDPGTGDWIVNGQKMWTTGGHAADYIWLAVRTDPDAPKHKGISVLIVDTRDPGYSWTPIITCDGSHHVNATYYNDVRVPADMLVGEENEGWRLITTQLNHERVMLGPAGRLEGLRDLVIDWARDRTAPDGTPLLEVPSVRQVLSRVTASFRINELLNWQVAASTATGTAAIADASASKVFASDEVQGLGLALQDVVASYGDPAEPATAELLDYLDRTAKRNLVLTFGGGVNEVQRELIAMFGLGLPKVPR